MHTRWIRDGLSEYLKAGHAVWHMPGHKRKACFGDVLDSIHAWDVTEVPGTDDLYLPEGFLRQSLAQLRDIYQTCGTFYAVNGSTGGIFTAVAACTNPGDTVLIARNCHKSVYNAVDVLQLHAEYIQPSWKPSEIADAFTQEIDGYIDVGEVEKALHKHPEIKAVIVTSPTYEGVISDIKAISRVAQEAGAYVIVDEAHGAHLPFINPQRSAVSMGADVVVQSLHKTLPAMTQTALVHVCTAALVEKVQKKLEIFQTSSPSYILMMSMEAAVCYMADHSFQTYQQSLHAFRQAWEESRYDHVHLLSQTEVCAAGAYGLDETRLTCITGEPGPAVLRLLDQEGDVVCEMAGKNHVVLISTVLDEPADFENLYRTIKKVEGKLQKGGIGKGYGETAEIDFHALIGTMAEAPVYVYPPGSYIVTTGEMFTKEIVDQLCADQAAGLHIRGL